MRSNWDFIRIFAADMRKIFVILTIATLLTGCTGHSRRSEIEARRQAIAQRQDSALADAQARLALVDSMLEAVKAEHDREHAWVMSHATTLSEQSPEVLRLNRLRARRDSLEAEWQTLGAKIRYIRRLQEKHQDNNDLKRKEMNKTTN